MVENRPLQNVLNHLTLIAGIVMVGFSIYITMVASGHEALDVMTTIVMGTDKMLTVMDEIPDWNITMVTAILAALPPLVVVVVIQRQFVKGLLETEK